MNWFEALILGLIQGLTEFLPVSSSGHLELGKVLLNVNIDDSLMFIVVVHGATVLSTIIVFRKYIKELLIGLFKFQWNKETQYLFKIAISMIPVGIVGVFFKDEVKQLFSNGDIVLVGVMLLITAVLLAFTFFAKSKDKDISWTDSFVIGIAQACAVLPGISRSGATIATGLLLKNKKENVAKFSFLMVLLPILGENFLELFSGELTNNVSIGTVPLIVGFLAAFVSGLLACSWMLKIVKKGKLIYFAIYCAIIGALAIIL